MYLTRLVLNPAHRGVWRDLNTPYEFHRTLHRILDEGRGEKPQRVLFRIEPWQPGTRGADVLVQTAYVRPDWSALPNGQNGYCLHCDGPKQLAPELKLGQRLAFRLVANPTKKQGNKRTALDEEEAYAAWLGRKMHQAGADVVRANALPFWLNEEQLRRQPNRYSKAQIPHFGVRFDGILQVTDADDLLDAVRRGIGPAKAFGFGLLSLAPA